MQVSYKRDVTYKITLELTASEAAEIAHALKIGTNRLEDPVLRTTADKAFEYLINEIGDRADDD